MKCRDCENLIWGYAEGERIWQCRERYCPDLDIERDCPDFAPQKPDIFTAFSTLQAENEKLRAELEQVKRERDTAVEYLRGQCRYCKRNLVCTSRKGPHFNCWQWRGQKED